MVTAARPVVIFTNSVVMGGMEEHIVQLARGLRGRGVPVAVICSRDEAIGPMREALTATGADVHALSPRRASLFGAIPRATALAQVMRRYPRGILHLHFTGHGGGDIATIVARAIGFRAIVRTVHLPPLRTATRMERIGVRVRDSQLARIICVSEQTRHDHLTLLDRDARKCVVVHNGVDLTRFSPETPPVDVAAEFGIDPAAPIVGTVARLGERRKGIHDLLSAVPMIVERHPATRFLIIGDGPLLPDLRAQAEALGIASRVAFAGHRNDVPALLAAMTVFASPSLYEACQYNLLEAMATGVPAVSTPAGVAPEVIRHGTTGLLVPIGEPTALATAVSELLADLPRAREIGRLGRQVIAERFSVEAMVDQIADVYAEVAS